MLAHNFLGVDEIHPRFPKKPSEIMKIHFLSLIFHQFSGVNAYRRRHELDLAHPGIRKPRFGMRNDGPCPYPI